VKLVVDMNLSIDWIPALQGANIEAVHWTTIGEPDASDEAVMNWAEANGAVVLTRDLDFAAMLTVHGLGSPSVIQLRTDQWSIIRLSYSVCSRYIETSLSKARSLRWKMDA
jgi:predicted nuclease of predicted toxin-antitoxin system